MMLVVNKFDLGPLFVSLFDCNDIQQLQNYLPTAVSYTQPYSPRMVRMVAKLKTKINLYKYTAYTI